MLHTMVCDVSNEEECKRFIQSTVETFGTIDILINNAGISMRSLFDDTDTDVIRQLMDVNFMGVVYCTKAALPFIIEQKGTIVGISSAAGYRGLPGRSGYSASKFALQGWLESLRTELMYTGRSCDVGFSWFYHIQYPQCSTEQQGSSQGESVLDESKLMSAETCAKYILNAIEKRKRVLVLTFTGKFTVFLNKFFPSLADKLVHQHYFKNGELVK